MNTNRKFTLGLASFLMITFVSTICFAQDAQVYGEAAWQDDSIGRKVVVRVYGDTLSGADPLISFGIRLTYPSDLTLDTSKPSTGYVTGTNKEVWYFGNSAPGEEYTDIWPENDTETVAVGGILDTDVPTAGKDMDRTLMATFVFTLKSGAEMPPKFGLTYGRPGKYNDFVDNTGKVLDPDENESPEGEVEFEHPDYPEDAVRVAEAGDANGDGDINSIDFQVTQNVFTNNLPYTVWADCDGNGDVNSLDFQCTQFRFIN